MIAVRDGDAAAFDEIFRRYGQPIWAYFRRRLDDPARAEELAQETFLAVLRGAERYEPRALFRTYLYRIAANQLANHRRLASSRSKDLAPATPAAGSRVSLDDAMWIRQAVARLDPIDRDVVMLREYEDLNYEEIAAVLGIPINTVRSRLYRAREALRQLLMPEASLKGRVS